MSEVNWTRALSKIVPVADGEDTVRWRTGIVDAINMDGTLNVAISMVIVPNIPVIAGADVQVGDKVHIVVYLGALIAIGKTGPPGSPFALAPIAMAMGVGSVPLLIGGASTTVNVTIRPTLADMDYAAAATIFGSVTLLSTLSITAITKASTSQVNVTVQNTGLISLSGGFTMVTSVKHS